ncbi:hypothetical protein IX339_001904 [Porphyromonas levii]|nr:hypothetical protein [Porphyromonas levii]
MWLVDVYDTVGYLCPSVKFSRLLLVDLQDGLNVALGGIGKPIEECSGVMSKLA